METVVAGCSEHIDSPTQSSLRETTRDDVRNVRTARKQTRRTVTPELLAKVADLYRENGEFRFGSGFHGKAFLALFVGMGLTVGVLQ